MEVEDALTRGSYTSGEKKKGWAVLLGRVVPTIRRTARAVVRTAGPNRPGLVRLVLNLFFLFFCELIEKCLLFCLQIQF
jgi:hypothetical protein